MGGNRHFVLVPGAWLDGGVFDEVAEGLGRAGHDVTALTLPGLAQRRQIDGSEVGLEDHVREILSILEAEGDPERVILVGHSYSGIPVGQAASVFEHEIGRVVYLDANVPHDGTSFADGWTEQGRAVLMAAIGAGEGYWPPITPDELEDQDLSPDEIETLLSHATPHPGKTLTDPARLVRPLPQIPTTYVKCLIDWPEPSEDVKTLLLSPDWGLVEMNTGHWPMVSSPVELSEVLLRLP
jgi:pimeloyl-ACP methyl ester carboxylesterase